MAITASSYLSKTLSASNRKTWTFSTWFKLPDNPVSDKVIWANSYEGNNAKSALLPS